jgi:hypothetical protein
VKLRRRSSVLGLSGYFSAEDQIAANPGTRYAPFRDFACAADDRLGISSSVQALRGEFVCRELLDVGRTTHRQHGLLMR